jgi:hypothetical protein
MKLMPVKEADKHIREHLETTQFYDETSGELYEPSTPPPDPSPDPDDDSSA